MLFDDPRYHWRETYFVLTAPEKRPVLTDVEREIAQNLPALHVVSRNADAAGYLESLSIVSPENRAGVDILWCDRPGIMEEIGALIDDIAKEAKPRDRQLLDRARQARAKIELLHLELLETPTGTSREELSSTNPPTPKVSPPPTSKPAATTSKTRTFRFDPDRYIAPPADLDTGENDSDTFLLDEYDSAVMTPDTLIVAMEALRRLTGGVVVDAAGGCLL